MRNRSLRLVALILLLAVFLSPATALAGNEWRPYDLAAFRKARAAGKTVFVSVHADW
jgi:hypothetical protein